MEKKNSFSQKEVRYSFIPKKELKCVWMTAGMLSYKLCKYDLQCEKCPLDRELRNLSPTSSFDSGSPQEVEEISATEEDSTTRWEMERPGEGFSREDPSLLNIKEPLFYHPGHTWVKLETPDEVRVGLDCFLGRIIGKITGVVLPPSGKRCLQGQDLCSIIQKEGILDAVSPISGLILSVNQKLKGQPELITRDPLGDGFLLTLKPKNLQRDQKHLFSGKTALSWQRKEWERFKTAVISEIHHGQVPYRNAPIHVKMFRASVISDLHHGLESPGITMQDGELNLSDIKKSIGPERYIQLVNALLREGEKER